MIKLKSIILFSFLFVSGFFAQDSTQTFLTLNSTGVEEFLKMYPKYDGRGTIVLVLDTGIDMGIDGLKKTSTGEVKVIDVQDFTGQGDVQFYEADTDEEDGKTVYENEDQKFHVESTGQLAFEAIDGNYFIGLLPEELWKNSNSGAADVNGNGTKDDKFYFITFKTTAENDTFWVVYVDTDIDGDLADENPLRNYKEKFDTFTIPNEKGIPNFTIAVNIFPAERKVNFFFDDGSHGTHCAGIATGYHIDGSPDFNGVAPGAKLMGLKLGNNNFAGGATVTESMKKAYLYADKVSREREEPCIINMSFGVGSEIEGRADIEKFLEKLVKDNPYLYISTSNGNEGPGISTTGMPAATNAIFSTGAVLTKEVGRDLFDSELDDNIILHFSSRGGEVLKPNVVSPGACTSTVPNFSRGDRFWGTSMASPYSAGVMALLLSAAKAKYPGVKIPSRLLYKVLTESATKMEGYDVLDQGGGYINVMNAWNLLQKYIKANEHKKFETYTIKSFAPNMPGGSAPNLYIRNGLFLTGKEKFNFSVKRDNFLGKKKFFRTYIIKSFAGWLKPVKRKTYIRNNQTTTVSVRIDKSKLSEPGLYNGIIKAFRADKSRFPEFTMMATVVIPYQFNEENDYEMNWNNIELKPGEHKRFFIQIPPGASSMKVKMKSNPDTYAFAWYFLHDPDGRQLDRVILRAEDETTVEKDYFDLIPGAVYELDVLGVFRASGNSVVNLSVEFSGIKLNDQNILTPDDKKLTFVNTYNEVKNYIIGSEISGYYKKHIVHLENTDYYSLPFIMTGNESKKTFKISISKEDFNKTTDFAIMIYNEDGKALELGGLTYRSDEISIRNKFKSDSTKLNLVLRPAFANEAGNMTVTVEEFTYIKNPPSFIVTYSGKPAVSFYPSVETGLDCKFGKVENIPEGAMQFGKVYFENRNTEQTEMEIPVFFNFKGSE